MKLDTTKLIELAQGLADDAEGRMLMAERAYSTVQEFIDEHGHRIELQVQLVKYIPKDYKPEQVLNIEEQERFDKSCGECGTELTDNNRSGWFRFYGDKGDIQIEVCKDCNDQQPNAVKSNGEDTNIGLVMPFFTDAPEFAYGFEAGKIWEECKAGKSFDGQPIHRANKAQIELILVEHNYQYKITDDNEDWSTLDAHSTEPQ